MKKILDNEIISFKKIILLAVICGVFTGIVLNLESILNHTSIFNIGTDFEFWVFMAVIIVSKSKSPLDAGIKTFIFFLISQPLVYLVEVPFSPLHWHIFKYYPDWFIWTILTFPGAMIAYLTNKKNWLSVFIFMFAVLFLSVEFALHFSYFINNIPYQFLSLVFILFQICLYVTSFKEKKKRNVFGILSIISIISITILLFNY